MGGLWWICWLDMGYMEELPDVVLTCALTRFLPSHYFIHMIDRFSNRRALSEYC